MHPAKVRRDRIERFTDLPNIGPAMARDFALLGYRHPAELAGVDAWVLYQSLCTATGQRHDPCVLDTFLSVADFLNGGEAAPWWHFTAQRKRDYGQLPEKQA